MISIIWFIVTLSLTVFYFYQQILDKRCEMPFQIYSQRDRIPPVVSIGERGQIISTPFVLLKCSVLKMTQQCNMTIFLLKLLFVFFYLINKYDWWINYLFSFERSELENKCIYSRSMLVYWDFCDSWESCDSRAVTALAGFVWDTQVSSFEV